MTNKNTKKKVFECKARDNVYLHRDFHGALCYAIKYLDENYTERGTEEYLRQVGRTYFSPLSKKLKEQGLQALEQHWHNVFTNEDGRFSMNYEGPVLVLKVEKCPAIAHLKKIGQLFTDRYCQTTVIVNDAICSQAGYCCSCEYEPGQGRCIQKFWEKEGAGE